MMLMPASEPRCSCGLWKRDSPGSALILRRVGRYSQSSAVKFVELECRSAAKDDINKFERCSASKDNLFKLYARGGAANDHLYQAVNADRP